MKRLFALILVCLGVSLPAAAQDCMMSWEITVGEATLTQTLNLHTHPNNLNSHEAWSVTLAAASDSVKVWIYNRPATFVNGVNTTPLYILLYPGRTWESANVTMQADSIKYTRVSTSAALTVQATAKFH